MQVYSYGFHSDGYFNKQVKNIYSTPSDSEDFIGKINELETWAVSQDDPFISWRLAFLFQNHINTASLQDKIIASKNARLLFNFAYFINKSDKVKLQEELFKTKDIFYIARFGCVIDDCDIEKIFSMVKLSKNAKAAYLLVKSKKNISAYDFKETFLESKKPRYLYSLAMSCENPEELNAIEDLILKSESFTYICKFANNISLANIKKIESWILKTTDLKLIKKYANTIKSERLSKLSVLF